MVSFFVIFYLVKLNLRTENRRQGTSFTQRNAKGFDVSEKLI
jgi:hypothetical protein